MNQIVFLLYNEILQQNLQKEYNRFKKTIRNDANILEYYKNI